MGEAHGKDFSVELERREGFRFAIDFGMDGVAPLLVDEEPPLGGGAGPDAKHLLAAAVANCMSASLLFCLQRARVDVLDLRSRVEGSVARNEEGRLRIGALRVSLEPVVPPEQEERMQRCMDLFEDFCTVGQSVRTGIDITVSVAPGRPDVAAHPETASPAEVSG